MTDLKFAFRMLRKNFGFTAVAILTLALGIGATTAIYSVVHDVILRPIPGAQADQLVVVEEYDTKQQWDLGVSATQYQELLEQTNLFKSVACMTTTFGQQLHENFAESIRGFHVTPNFFEVLRVQPQHGRLFASDIRFDGDEKVMVLNHDWWLEHFDGDTNVIGRPTKLEGIGGPMTIIGVAPPSFQFPDQVEFCHFWIPAQAEPRARPGNPRHYRNWRTVARLQPGVALEQAQAALSAMSARLAEQFPESNATILMQLKPLQSFFSDKELRHIYFGLLAAIVIVLLIGSANVANLLLAKAETRRQEMAVRLAMGATRARLIRQTLIECLLLSLIAGLGGLLFAAWGIGLLKGFLYGTIPLLREIRMDTTVFGIALALATVTGIGFGLAPAWQTSRAKINDALKSAQRSIAGAPKRWLAKTLVVTEIALALVLLIGAGLMVTSVNKVLSIDPGYDHRNLVRVGLETGMVEVPWRDLYVTQRSIMERFKNLPSVESVGLVTPTMGTEYEVEGHDEPVYLTSRYCSVDDYDYFEALKAPLIAGRHFDQSDASRGRRTIIINQSLANQFWPNKNALGKRLRYSGRSQGNWLEVIGVVGDIRESGFDYPAGPTIYEPATRRSMSYAAIMIRTSGSLDALTPAVRSEVVAIASGFATPKIDTVENMLRESSKSRRACMNMFLLFAAVGLLLAVMGIYSVTAYAAARRTHEIGVRVALGARKPDIFRLIITQGIGLISVGILIGWAAAFALTRLLESLLYEVSPTDPKVFVMLACLLALVALIGCILPARKATTINPTEALRHE